MPMADNPLQEQAKALVREWQERLRLQDWRVETEVVRHYQIDNAFDGHIQRDKYSRRAKMELLHPDDRPPDRLAVRDTEQTIIHELLHLWLEPFEPKEDTAEDVLFEVAINAIADALVESKRQERKGETDGRTDRNDAATTE